MSIFAGIFFILHAVVHLLYAGQALRFFELRPGLTWPDGAWLFSRLLGDPATRWLAAISLALAALGFISAWLGLFFGAGWARTVTFGAAAFSVLVYLLFWDGKFHELPDQGGIGLLISLGILLLTLAFWSGPAPLQSDEVGLEKCFTILTNDPYTAKTWLTGGRVRLLTAWIQFNPLQASRAASDPHLVITHQGLRITFRGMYNQPDQIIAIAQFGASLARGQAHLS